MAMSGWRIGRPDRVGGSYPVRFWVRMSVALAAATGVQTQTPAHGLIRLSKAIGIAESQLSGRAIEADLQSRDGRLVYERPVPS